ncbi:MAG: Rrf2 family transcriptional regulator [bacterium]|nr:Rrf2 family transcriptional regulator [bacterium]
MNLSQKCQYALRAVYELSKRKGSGPTSIREIAEVQAIPTRFLELILGQLKQTGYVESRRGVDGGYLLAVAPEELNVGDIIRFVEGPLDPVKCIAGSGGAHCPLMGNCAFTGLWERAKQAVADVYDNTTFRDLMEEEQAKAESYVATYSI